MRSDFSFNSIFLSQHSSDNRPHRPTNRLLTIPTYIIDYAVTDPKDLPPLPGSRVLLRFFYCDVSLNSTSYYSYSCFFIKNENYRNLPPPAFSVVLLTLSATVPRKKEKIKPRVRVVCNVCISLTDDGP